MDRDGLHTTKTHEHGASDMGLVFLYFGHRVRYKIKLTLDAAMAFHGNAFFRTLIGLVGPHFVVVCRTTLYCADQSSSLKRVRKQFSHAHCTTNTLVNGNARFFDIRLMISMDHMIIM